MIKTLSESQSSAADYIADLAHHMSVIAGRNELILVRYFLDMASETAYDIHQGRLLTKEIRRRFELIQ